MCWSLYLNRLFQPEKKGVWTETMVYYTSYSFRDIEAVVKKVASVVKASASKNQVSLLIILFVVDLSTYIFFSLVLSGGMTNEQ